MVSIINHQICKILISDFCSIKNALILIQFDAITEKRVNFW